MAGVYAWDCGSASVGQARDPHLACGTVTPQGVNRQPCRRGLGTGKRATTAVVVADQAAETTGMTLVERAEPQGAINDVITQVYGSGIRPD